MVLVAKVGREQEVLDIFHKWDLDAAVIGAVTGTGQVVIKDAGKVVADLPVKPLTDGAPIYDRPIKRPDWLDGLQHFDPKTVAAPTDLGAALTELLARPTIASKEWVYRQYDHQVRLGGVVLPGAADAAVVRVERGKKGIAIKADCNSRFVYLDPYEGARLAVAECTRNVSCVGGEPLGLTDCLNFGNPERPENMWQFAEAVRGLADACRQLGVPVVSGNVSLYNDTDGKSIFPTPAVAVVGLVPDATKRMGMAFVERGDLIALLGTTRGELGGSEWLHAQGKTAGLVPRLDADAELRLQCLLRKLAREGLVHSSHDCSEGGLGVSLAESCIADPARMLGCTLTASPRELAAHQWLFAEDASRAVISFAAGQRAVIQKLCAEEGVPFEELGTVGGEALEIPGVLNVKVSALSAAWRQGFPKALGLG
jgi:phosphoribosylformylglycinamidine synthase II